MAVNLLVYEVLEELSLTTFSNHVVQALDKPKNQLNVFHIDSFSDPSLINMAERFLADPVDKRAVIFLLPPKAQPKGLSRLTQLLYSTSGYSGISTRTRQEN